jgi:hypothetical protein
VATQLYPHQKEALTFLLEREKEAKAPKSRAASLWTTRKDSKGRTTWYNIVTQKETRKEPAECKGAILADDVRLGCAQIDRECILILRIDGFGQNDQRCVAYCSHTAVCALLWGRLIPYSASKARAGCSGCACRPVYRRAFRRKRMGHAVHRHFVQLEIVWNKHTYSGTRSQQRQGQVSYGRRRRATRGTLENDLPRDIDRLSAFDGCELGRSI